MGGLVMKEGNLDRTTTCDADSLIPIEMRRSFYDVLKRGVYKELHRRKMLSDGQLCFLLKPGGGSTDGA